MLRGTAGSPPISVNKWKILLDAPIWYVKLPTYAYLILASAESKHKIRPDARLRPMDQVHQVFDIAAMGTAPRKPTVWIIRYITIHGGMNHPWGGK